jgi:hypothetical protein
VIEFWIWVYLRWIPVEALSPLGLALLWLARGLAVVGLLRIGLNLARAWHRRPGPRFLTEGANPVGRDPKTTNG